MSKQVELTVPDLGDFSDVEVIELLAAPGDRIEAEEGLVSVETDKAAMDVPSTTAGKVVEFKVAVGDRVNKGDVIAVIETDVAVTEAEAAPTPASSAIADAADKAVAVAAEPAAKSDVELVVPDIGDFSDAEVIEVSIAPGDQINVEDALITLETDKASMDIPAAAAGEVLEVLVSVGARVSKGAAIARIRATVSETTPAQAATETQPPATTQTVAKVSSAPLAAAPAQQARNLGKLPPVDETGFSAAHATPSVRKLARELGVSLGQVKGSGRKGRITHEDVKNWVKQVLSGAAGFGAASLPTIPEVDFSAFGEVELQPLSRIQKISGPRLQASWVNLPHVTQHDLADITELEVRRQKLKGPAKERGIGLTPLAFIVRAVIKTLNDYPVLASSLAPDSKSLVMKSYRHIGFAADTPGGLMVPVIRNADRLDVYEIAAELGALSAAAREGKLKANQMQGGVFTISSLGGIGGTAFTPIVNAPEVGILGVSRSLMQPVWDGSEFKPRLMLPLSLSYDHRVVDGALAVRFTTRLGEYLSDVGGLIEATP